MFSHLHCSILFAMVYVKTFKHQASRAGDRVCCAENRNLAIYVMLIICIGSIYYSVGTTYASITARAACMAYVAGCLTFMSIGGFPSFVEDMKVKILQEDKILSKLSITILEDTVLSYYNVLEEMAQAVISMASAQVSTSGLSLEIPSDGNIHAENEATEKDLPVKAYAHFGLKQARRASLQRFLEKRRERCRESAVAYSESKDKPKIRLPPSLPASVRDPFGFLSGTRNSMICATRQ